MWLSQAHFVPEIFANVRNVQNELIPQNMGLTEEERKGFDTLFNVDPDTREWNTPEVCCRSRCIQLYYVRQCFMRLLYIQVSFITAILS
jgi:hypothetical protein